MAMGPNRQISTVKGYVLVRESSVQRDPPRKQLCDLPDRCEIAFQSLI